jgi:hypothetical protein
LQNGNDVQQQPRCVHQIGNRRRFLVKTAAVAFTYLYHHVSVLIQRILNIWVIIKLKWVTRIILNYIYYIFDWKKKIINVGKMYVNYFDC